MMSPIIVVTPSVKIGLLQ